MTVLLASASMQEHVVSGRWVGPSGPIGLPATVRHQLDVEAFQRFHDYAELEAKLARQGPTSLERINHYRGQQAISIPMPYRVALL